MKALSCELSGNLRISQSLFGEQINPREQLLVIPRIRLAVDGWDDLDQREMSTDPDDFDFDEINGDLGGNHTGDQSAQQTLFVLIADLSTGPQSWKRWSHLFERLSQFGSKRGKERTLLKALGLFFCLPLRQQFLFPTPQKSRPRPSDCQ